MSSEIGTILSSANVPRPTRLTAIARRFKSKKFRDAYLSRHIRAFLAAQIRALRGDVSQTQFAKKLETHQSIVSRYEREDAGNLNVGTLIDIARKLEVGLLVRFVDYPTFLKWSDEHGQLAYVPESYNQDAVDELIERAESQAQSSALRVLFSQVQEPPKEPPKIPRPPISAAGKSRENAEIINLEKNRKMAEDSDDRWAVG